MEKDIRGTALYAEAAALYRATRQPGSGRVCDAIEVHASPTQRRAVFTGTLDDQHDVLTSRICEIDLVSGELHVLSYGPHTDRSPKYSPDGSTVAFLSDSHAEGDFQLYLLDVSSRSVRRAPSVHGWVEYSHWSPDGTRLLLGVAGHGADVAGGQGAVSSKQLDRAGLPSWMPSVSTGDEGYRWRNAWVYRPADDNLKRVGPSGANIWEAVWCGNESIVAVVSDEPSEGAWYSAQLQIINIETQGIRQLLNPRDQLGWPAASPSGDCVAVVEAVCSDRGIVAGDVRLIDVASGDCQPLDTRGIDVTFLEWCSDGCLLLAGHRGFTTAVARYDRRTRVFQELWSSDEISSTSRYVAVSGLNERGDCVLLCEGFVRAPEVGVIGESGYKTVRSFDLGYEELARSISMERVRWNAPDGLEIQGWLLRPQADAPHPLIMFVHGGPISLWHPMWLSRARTFPILMLLKRGFAVFLPNPRGSAGRGQEFSRRVVGDVGGADAHDCLSGIDHLIDSGMAHPHQLGVTGVSYGGYMTCWLVTQDHRFAAAVAVAPITNYVTEQLLSNIPDFVRLFLADSYTNPAGRYFQRSPVMYADNVRTPILNICGALDRCTPPHEAAQFHQALRSRGVESALVTYPEEGHGVRKFPAALDYAARLVAWFEEHVLTTPQK